MSKPRKILIIILLLIGSIGISLMFFFGKKIPPPTSFAIPTPNIPNSLKGNFEINLAIEESEFIFPAKASLVNKSTISISKEESDIIANNLGFTGSPITAEDITDGTTYIYQLKNASLVVYSKLGKFSYTLNVLPSATNKQLTNEEIFLVAKNFLIQNSFAKEGDLDLSSMVFLKESSGEGIFLTTKEDASIFQVNLSPNSLGERLVTLNPKDSPYFVQVLPDGSVFSAKTQKLSLQKGINSYNIKSFEELKTTIGESKLVSINDGNIYLPDIKEGDIGPVKITKVSIAYLLESSDTLQPIFLLEGEVELKGIPEKLRAVLYLSAFSSQP